MLLAGGRFLGWTTNRSQYSLQSFEKASQKALKTCARGMTSFQSLGWREKLGLSTSSSKHNMKTAMIIALFHYFSTTFLSISDTPLHPHRCSNNLQHFPTS